MFICHYVFHLVIFGPLLAIVLVLFLLSVKSSLCWAWWCTLVILPLRRLRQEDCELDASLGFIVKPYKQTNKPNTKNPQKTKTKTTNKQMSKSSLYILDNYLLSDICFANIFSPFVVCLFILLQSRKFQF
jgi:hypothetical protein